MDHKPRNIYNIQRTETIQRHQIFFPAAFVDHVRLTMLSLNITVEYCRFLFNVAEEYNMEWIDN